VKRHIRAALVAVVVALAFFASAGAWWWYRGDFIFAAPLAPIFRHLSFLERDAFLWFPGWLAVDLIGGDGPATALTDVLIPILAGLFWSWIGISILGTIQKLRDRGHWARLTRTKQAEFVIVVTILVLVIAGSIRSLLGWWERSLWLGLPLLFGVPILIFALIFGHFISLLFKFAHWLVQSVQRSRENI